MATLVNRKQTVGSYSISFDSQTNGYNFSSGVYFYRLVAESIAEGQSTSFVEIKKMILLK